MATNVTKKALQAARGARLGRKYLGGSTAEVLDRKTLATQLYEILERKIIAGELTPGMHLSEESLAVTYKVSRSPAREALMELEKYGLAVRVGARDRIITIPTREMISAKFDLWWIVDLGRTYLSSLNAAPEDRVELREHLDRMARAAKARDIRRYQSACDKWHGKIRQLCPNSFVNQSSEDCAHYLKWLEVLYDRAPDLSEQNIAEHRAILNAYEERDLAALSIAMRDHITRKRDQVVSMFESSRMAEKKKAPLAG